MTAAVNNAEAFKHFAAVQAQIERFVEPRARSLSHAADLAWAAERNPHMFERRRHREINRRLGYIFSGHAQAEIGLGGRPARRQWHVHPQRKNVERRWRHGDWEFRRKVVKTNIVERFMQNMQKVA